jgi:hypothetical protein
MGDVNEITTPEQLHNELVESAAKQDVVLRKKMDSLPDRKHEPELDNAVISDYYDKAAAIYKWTEENREKYIAAFKKFYKEI